MLEIIMAGVQTLVAPVLVVWLLVNLAHARSIEKDHLVLIQMLAKKDILTIDDLVALGMFEPKSEALETLFSLIGRG